MAHRAGRRSEAGKTLEGGRVDMRALLDLDLAVEGYLLGPDGRLRYICGLDRIMRDAVAAGAIIAWNTIGAIGCCYVLTRLIELHPILIEGDPWFVRDVISHELGHAVLGAAEEAVRVWQGRSYGDLVEPPPFLTDIRHMA